MKELDDLLSEWEFIKRNSVDYNLSDIEKVVGFKLPVDYKYYINHYGAFEGFVGKEFVMLYDFDELLELNQDNSEESLNTILIGSNGGSESIGIRFNEDKSYNLVIAQYLPNIEDHIIIGTSFTDMLQRLADGKEWFQ